MEKNRIEKIKKIEQKALARLRRGIDNYARRALKKLKYSTPTH